MIELSAKIIKTGENVVIEDPDPTKAALLFKSISDNIWENKEPGGLALERVGSVIDPAEARDAINEVVKHVDEKLVISGIGKALDLGLSWHGERKPVIVEADIIDSVANAAICTYNWDSRMTGRLLEIDGKRVGAEFTDGHTDYYRELAAMFSTEAGILTYAMQRQQAQQGSPAAMYLNFSHRDFLETGYEGHQLGSATLSDEQETEFLKVLQRMGGIELDHES